MTEKQEYINFDDDAEKALLGTIIISNERARKVLEEITLLEPAHFMCTYKARIFEIIKYLESTNQNIDVISILNQVKKDHNVNLKTIVNKAYLDDMIYNSTLISNPSKIVNLLIDLYKRRLINKEINRLPNTDTDAFIKNVNEIDSLVNASTLDGAFLDIPELLADYSKEVSSSVQSYQTEFNAFKHPLKFPKMGLVILAARSKVGKTTLSLQFAKKLSYETKICYFSLEMPRVQALHKFFALPTQNTEGVSPSMIIGGPEAASKYPGGLEKYTKQFNAAVRDIEQYPVYFTHGYYNTDEIMALMRRQIEKGIRVFFIDQLSQIKWEKGARDKKTTYETSALKLSRFCKKENVLIFVLAQCNRNSAGRDSKIPEDTDLAETDTLLHEADIIILGAREDDAIKSTWKIKSRHFEGSTSEVPWNKSLGIYEDINTKN